MGPPPGRPGGPTGRDRWIARPEHCLTGPAVCGLCGRKLVAHPDSQGTTRYACARPRGCGRIVVAGRYLEPLIAEAIALRLDSPEFRAAVEARGRRTDVAVDVGRLQADESALEEAARSYFVERGISKAEYQAVRADLEKRNFSEVAR